jgi:hypothetical protein
MFHNVIIFKKKGVNFFIIQEFILEYENFGLTLF